MKKIRPDRGPSLLGGIVGIVMICVGICWTVVTSKVSTFMPAFGVVWTGIAIVQTVCYFVYALGKRRTFRHGGRQSGEKKNLSEGRGRVCPCCGAAVQEDIPFCSHCGKKLVK